MKGILKIAVWPLVVFFLALIFLFLFKNPLVGLTSRITSIDKAGIKTS